MSHGRHLADDLLLPHNDTAQTVQVGHSPLPFDESDCDLPVRISELPSSRPRQQSIETMMIRRARVEADTVLLEAARDPAEESNEETVVPRPRPRRRRSTTLIFVLLLLAISLASLAAGVVLGPMLAG